MGISVDQCREPDGRARTRGEGGNGHRRRARPGSGEGLENLASILIRPGETAVLADIDGPGAVQHIWLSMRPDRWRSLVLRFTWDNARVPAVQVPLGDFFCLGWDTYAPVNSRYVVVAPYCGLNTYWPMPFREHATVTLENIGEEEGVLYYYIDYGLGELPIDAAYFHAYWNRSNPVDETHIHTILPRVDDDGSYVGTHLSFGSNHTGWWGEGEVKFFIDEDRESRRFVGRARKTSSAGHGTLTSLMWAIPPTARPTSAFTR